MQSSIAIPIVMAPTINDPKFKSLPNIAKHPPAKTIGTTAGNTAIASTAAGDKLVANGEEFSGGFDADSEKKSTKLSKWSEVG